LAKYYLWVWKHGAANTPDLGGRLALLTANSLTGPWTDRGFVSPTPWLPPSAPSYWQTGGDVVWSPKYKKFYSVPHTIPMDSYLIESTDGVNWSLTSTTPVLGLGPAGTYDSKETGYGRLMLDPVQPNPAQERWIWLYRSGKPCGPCSNNSEYYTFAVARANDITGPWVKDAANPVFDPYAGATLEGSRGVLVGLDAFVYYDGWYQILWQESFGSTYLSRSRDLHTWEDYAATSLPDGQPSGAHAGVPVFVPGGGPQELFVPSGIYAWDDKTAQWTYVYLSWNAGQLLNNDAVKGEVAVNLARASGGHAP
jgi:hypothetical protein